MPKCDFVHEAWGPHEGCKEFMDEPETFPCTNDAAVRYTTFWEGPDYPDYRFIREISTTHACAEHTWDDVHDMYPPPYGPEVLFTEALDGSEF